MTVTEVLMGLGSWSVQLSEETPDYLLNQLGYFGHIAVVDGKVDPERIGDGLLTGAKYVGVLREKDNRTGRVLSGEGMAYWLGDEDGKGHLIETKLILTGKTFVQAVTAILALDNSVTLGAVDATRPGTYTGTHQFVTPREVLTLVCQAFGAEFRVNGSGSVDAGTPAFLYNTEAPDTILVRKGAGSDLDLVALGGEPEVQESARDYTTRAVLLGQTTPTDPGVDAVPFVTATADAPSVAYLDLFGHPLVSVRAISESGTTEGAAPARAQLQINRFARLTRSLKLNADEFDTEGNFVVGDSVWVYDPDTGVVNAANEVLFQGQVWHPESIRAVAMTWPVVEGYSVAFRTQAGVWLDLTRWIVFESSGTDITIGDLPQTLSGGGDSAIALRVDAATASGVDATTPNAPTGLTVTAFSGLNPLGQTVSILSPSWTAPGLNTDGTALTDLSHYLVQYRWTARTVWQEVVAAGTSVEVTVSPSLPYEVRVAAVDLTGHQSAWSATVPITSAKDLVAPPAPADPVVTSYLGQLRIEYIGTDATGNPMPTDTNRVDVHVGTTSAFVYSDATRVASLSAFGKGVAYATAPYSTTNNRWVRLVAYDHTGNVSASSAAIGGHTVQVGDGDIASLSVGKLTTGTITTDVIVAGNVLTALTGQRSGMTALGFQAWDASNNQTILLNGVANLLTGTLQTAISGRRIIIGAASNQGRIQFFAPDGTTTEIGGFTGATTGTEAIRMGLVYPALSTLWGKFQIQNSGNGITFLWAESQKFVVGGNNTGVGSFRINWATSKGTGPSDLVIPDESRFAVLSGGIYVDTPVGGLFRVAAHTDPATTLDRFMVDSNSVNIYADTGGPRAEFQNLLTKMWHGPQASTGWLEIGPGQITPAAATYVSNYIKMLTPTSPAGAVFGAIIKFARYSGGNPGIEIANVNDTDFERIKASEFALSSSGTMKKNMRDFGPGAMDKLRPVKVIKFSRKADPDEIEQVGIEAEQMPPELQLPGGKFGAMVPIGGYMAMILAGLQEVDARLDKLEKGGKP